VPAEVIRSTAEEKEHAIASLAAFQQQNAGRAPAALAALKDAALHGGNTFEALMQACQVCSLGQISAGLYEVGGQYRRNM
jgi:methylmalonyl-CoA mutase